MRVLWLFNDYCAIPSFKYPLCILELYNAKTRRHLPLVCVRAHTHNQANAGQKVGAIRLATFKRHIFVVVCFKGGS